MTKNTPDSIRYPVRLIVPDMLPHLVELARDLPGLLIEGVEEAGRESPGERKMAGGNPAELVSQMVAVCQTYEAARRLIQSQDELLEKTADSLGWL